MRLAYSTNAYRRFSFAETARRIADLGYQGLELLADVPHAWPAWLPESSKQAIRDGMSEHGLAFSNVNAFMMNAISDHRQPYWYPSWLEPDADYRRVRIDHTKRALTLCAELGAPHITTEPGGPISLGQSREEAMRMFADGLAPVLEHAADLGVLLLVEPEPGLLIETTDQYLELAAMLDSPALGLNFDVGHAFCMREDLPAAIARCAGVTRHYHLEDIAATRVHHHLVPGEGAIDFAAVVSAIRATGYDGWLTVELYPNVDDPDQAGARALEVIRPLVSVV
ncbi:MAG: sugar phosphate isomerase/epimerase family protein [Isosphaeraceae bacterium]|nr:sugar phosphate isomerase/epimerase family protein [Isosphaeraceae bacterium]